MDLTDLRAELDRIDDALHDLIMRRAAVVGDVAARKRQTGTPTNLRPGREAAILRRLLARHGGALPPGFIVRVWRELFAGALALQGPFAVAVTPGLDAVAREQFGALTPLHRHAQAAAALTALRGGAASVAVLPVDAGDTPWWPLLAGPKRLHVVGKLPFWAARPAGAEAAAAFVIAAAPADPSGDDRSLILGDAAVCGRLGGCGFTVGEIRPAGTLALAEVAGYVTDEDPRLAGLSGDPAAPVVLGAYACVVA